MARIRDFVKSNFGETYEKLTDVANYDDSSENPDAVGLKIKATLSRFGVTTEEGLNDFQKSYLADHATRLLIPLAIDYYMVNTRRVDNASRPSGLTPMGGEVGQNYDRVAALRRIDEILASRLIADLPIFESSLGESARMDVADGDNFLTIDPMTFPPGGAPELVGSGFGIGYVINPN
jgi:hypothetical protein